MRVRILTARPGHPAGSVADLDDAVAQALLARGDAELERVPAVETAMAEPVTERAVAQPRKGRGR